MIPIIKELYPGLHPLLAIRQALTDGIITPEEAGECYETYIRFVNNIHITIRSMS